MKTGKRQEAVWPSRSFAIQKRMSQHRSQSAQCGRLAEKMEVGGRMALKATFEDFFKAGIKDVG